MLFKSKDSSAAFSRAAFAILASAVKLFSGFSFWTDSGVPGEASNLFDLYLKPKNSKLPFKQI